MKTLTDLTIAGPVPLSSRHAKYNYIRKQDRTLWAVRSVADGQVSIWTINAWGRVFEETMPVSIFMETFEEYNG